MLLTRGALRGTLASALRGLLVYGLMIAFVSGWMLDVQIARHLRAANAELAELSADLPRDALVVTFAPEAAGFRVNRPPALTAQADFRSGKIDPALGALVMKAFAEGRPVFAQGARLAGQMVERGLAADGAPRYGIGGPREL